MDRQPFLTHCFALVICQHSITGKFLCVKETRNRGWWVSGGLVEPGEDFISAAIRETKEETGADIELKGVLRVEHSVYGHQTARMRIIFYATSHTDTPKQVSDNESDGAAWFTTEEIQNLNKIKPGLRGPEIIDWPIYVENGGLISPLNFLVDENAPIISKGFPNTVITRKGMMQALNDSLLKTLLMALESKNIEIVKELLIKGLDPNEIINHKNWTSLHYAIKTKNEELVKLLLISEADPKNSTAKKRNCFHFAMQSSFKVLKMILLAISDLELDLQKNIINSQDTFGDTPLHILAKDIVKYNTSDLSIFNYFVNLGGDPHKKNNEDLSPADIINSLIIEIE